VIFVVDPVYPIPRHVRAPVGAATGCRNHPAATCKRRA
jgi:hypothetical protein